MPKEVVEIRTSTGTPLAVFPPEFLTGNALNSWEYILDVVGLLLEEASANPHFLDCEGALVGYNSPPQCGIYSYIHRGASERHYSHDKEALTRKTIKHRSLHWLEVRSIFVGMRLQAQSEARPDRTLSVRVPPAVK